MTLHNSGFSEDLALYALGLLTGSDADRMKQHVAECADCQADLAQRREEMALVAVAVSGPKPPSRARDRLLQAVSRDSRSRNGAAAQTSPLRWWAWAGWAVAAALLIVAGFQVHENIRAKEQASALSKLLDSQETELTMARQIVSTLTADDAQRVTLVAAKTPPQPQGKVIYVRKRATLIFLATNFPTVPASKAYELWLIPITGAPLPAGTFRPDARGNATLVNSPLSSQVEAKAFAVTVEPQSGSPAPTSKPIVAGAGI